MTPKNRALTFIDPLWLARNSDVAYWDIKRPVVDQNKMQKINAVDTSKITLVRNKFEPEGTVLYDLKYEKKPFSIYSFGLVDSPALNSTNFGDKWDFKFKPPAEDYTGLGDVDVFDFGSLLDQDLGVHRSFLAPGYIMTIKLGQKKGLFGFANNVGLTKENINEYLVAGKGVTIIGHLSLYVRSAATISTTDDQGVITESEQPASYGLYFTLDDLQFEKAEVTPLKKATIRKTK